MDTNQNYEGVSSKKVYMTRSVTKTTRESAAPPSTEVKEGGDNKPSNKMLYIVFITLTIDLISFTIILPLLPSLLEYYGGQEKDYMYDLMQTYVSNLRSLVGAPDTAKWNSILFGGIIGSLFSMLQFISSPFMGALSDVYGRRPVMLVSMVGVTFSYVLWYFSHSFSLFVLSRIVGGLSKGNVSLCTAVMADILPQEKRGRGMAMIGIAFSIGFVIGPIIGAAFVMNIQQGDSALYTTPALVAFILSILALLILFACFQETLPVKRKSHSKPVLSSAIHLILPSSLFNFTALKSSHAVDTLRLQKVGFVYFAYLFIFSGLEFTLTFLTHTKFEFTSMQQGRMFFFIGIIMILVQGGFVRRVKAGQEQKTAVRGIVLLFPAFILIGFARNTSTLYCGLLLFSFAASTVVPCLTTIVSTLGTVEQRGTIMGIFRSLGALARALGPFFASLLYWSGGPAICYTVGALSLAIPLLFLCKVIIPQKQE